jgi:Xaa-Pro aminopeptidase
MDHERRLNKVVEGLRQRDDGIEALLVTNLTNVRYLTGFEGSNGMVLVTPSGVTFFSDSRYAARAADMVQAASIEIYQDRLTDALAGHLENTSKLGFEADTMTVSDQHRLAGRLSDVELVATSGLVEAIRRVKEPEEVDLIRTAVEIGDAAFEDILDRLAPGKTEREIALDLEVFMRRSGAEDVSFEPIVGSGRLSAHIHHTPSERSIEKGDLVLFDFGSRYDGYCSDLTRTVVMGAATDEQSRTYDLVLRAQAAAIDTVHGGLSGIEADTAARSVIEAGGEGKAFPHGLGHGIGLDVHEQPRLSRNSEDELVAGEVVTIEPGVYHTETGGIRIEDCVLVAEDGCEVLGTAPKDRLIEL